MNCRLVVVLTAGLAIASIFWATGAAAQQSDTWAVATIIEVEQDIKTTAARWVGPLQDMAFDLLMTLAVISLVLRFALLTVKGSDYQDFVIETIRFIAVIGIWTAAIEFSPQFIKYVVGSFMQAAMIAQGTSITPSAAVFLDLGITFVAEILQKVEGFAWLFAALVGAILVLMFAVISGYVLLVYAEMYIVTYGGILLLGFGSLQWTEEFGKRYLIYVVSVGAKLFALLLVVAFAQGMFETWTVGDDPGWGDVFALVAVGVIVMMMATMIPNMFQGIVNGSSIGSGGPALTGMMASAGSVIGRVAGGAIVAAVKTGMGTKAATGAAVAGMGATSVREAVSKAGGGVGGAAKVAARAAGYAGRASRAVMGRQMAADGSVLGELKGMRAAAEAMRDKTPASEGGKNE